MSSTMTVVNGRPEVQAFANELRRRANLQFKTRNANRMFTLPVSLERARARTLQMSLWTMNRRDCWGFAQGLAPFEVKQMIWEHEEDELAGNKARGVENHFALGVQQGALLGHTRRTIKTRRSRRRARRVLRMDPSR